MTGTFDAHLTLLLDEKQPFKVSAMQLECSSSQDRNKSSHKATVGSIVKIAGKCFYLAPAHVFSDRTSSQHMVSNEDVQEGDSDCEFGGFDNENESLGEEDETEFMSQHSITPEPSDVESGSDLDGDHYSSDVGYENTPSIAPQEELEIDTGSTSMADILPFKAEDTVGQVNTVRFEIKSPCIMSKKLDYAFIEINDDEYPLATLTLPIMSYESVRKVDSGDVDVTTMTGSGKALTGILSGRPSYIRLPNTKEYQEVFEVEIKGSLQPGDCGSIVRNARTGYIYGHIFAGDIASKVAYIIPAVDVMEAIKRNFIVRQRAFSYKDYTVGLICVLPLEYQAARDMLDEEYTTVRGENFPSYVLGRIGSHNVVIANPSSEAFLMKSASAMATDMRFKFPNIRFGLSVGTGLGFPTPSRDIHLGDIVVGTPSHFHSGVIQYGDFRNQIAIRPDQRTRMLDTTPKTLLAAVSRLQDMHKIRDGIDADHRHKGSEEPCPYCNDLKNVQPPSRSNHGPKVHYGLIISANKEIGLSKIRELCSRENHEVLCFEMEAAGLMSSLPCLFIRGISNYAHTRLQNKEH